MHPLLFALADAALSRRVGTTETGLFDWNTSPAMYALGSWRSLWGVL